MAYALALRNLSSEQHKYIYTATSVIVAVTVLFNGGLTKFIIDKLRIRYGEQVQSENVAVTEPSNEVTARRQWYYLPLSLLIHAGRRRHR